jgi:hypothetical protein
MHVVHRPIHVLAPILLLTIGFSACAGTPAAGGGATSGATATPASTLSPGPGEMTVYDSSTKVHWLADANLAATEQFGLPLCGDSNTVPCVNANGSMSYQAALAWVAAMNAAHYLGHANWQLPTTPINDPSCTSKGTHGANFGYECVNSALGSLYTNLLHLKAPNTAVPIPANTVGPFSNFQPYLYWSGTGSVINAKGFFTFSFDTGHLGGNVDPEYLYVLPMIEGKIPGTYRPTSLKGLQISADGQTVYDPRAGVTWLANADLAKTETFGAQCVNAEGFQCINPDGSMSRTTAEQWIAGMNKYHGGAGWLGHTDWVLPPTTLADATCEQDASGFDCAKSPMGELFYNQLGLKPGDAVIQTPALQVGPFFHLQPYLYWSCVGAADSQGPCISDAPASGFEFSFSFGNGFEDTDVGGPHILVGNNLFVTAYYPG